LSDTGFSTTEQVTTKADLQSSRLVLSVEWLSIQCGLQEVKHVWVRWRMSTRSS